MTTGYNDISPIAAGANATPHAAHFALVSTLFWTLAISLTAILCPIRTGWTKGASYNLEEAVSTALARNFTVISATEDMLAAGQSKKAALSAFGPAAGTGYDYNHRQHRVTSSGQTVDRNLFGWRIYLTQNVFAGFSTLADYQKATLMQDSAQAGIARARIELIRTVQENFFTYIKAKYNTQSARDALERLQSQLASSRALYEAGASPQLDVLQAEVDVSTAENALLIAENAVETQSARLNTLLLLPLDADVEYKGDLTFVPLFLTQEQCLTMAYSKRPDLIIAEKAVLIAEKDIIQAQSGFYPRVDATTEWGTVGDSPMAAGSANQKRKYNEWTVGVTARWDVFEWGKTTYETRSAGHAKSRARAEAENLRTEISFEVKQRLLAMNEAAKRIKVTQKGVTQAREAYRTADARYRQQVGLMTDVLDAQSNLSLAEASLAGARADYSISLSGLFAAIGVENPGLKPR